MYTGQLVIQLNTTDEEEIKRVVDTLKALLPGAKVQLVLDYQFVKVRDLSCYMQPEPAGLRPEPKEKKWIE